MSPLRNRLRRFRLKVVVPQVVRLDMLRTTMAARRVGIMAARKTPAALRLRNTGSNRKAATVNLRRVMVSHRITLVSNTVNSIRRFNLHSKEIMEDTHLQVVADMVAPVIRIIITCRRRTIKVAPVVRRWADQVRSIRIVRFSRLLV